MAKWTDEENRILQENLGAPIKVLKEKLNHSERGICLKLNSAGAYRVGKVDLADVFHSSPCGTCRFAGGCKETPRPCPKWNRWYHENHIWGTVTEPFRRLRERGDTVDQRRNDPT